MSKAATLIAVAALPTLVGCSLATTTQTKNDRIKLERERELATRSAVVVKKANPEVRVERVGIVRSGGKAVAVVSVRNLADRPVTDLPVSVGVRGGAGARLLNSRAGLPYFDNHLPAIAPRGSVVWVVPLKGPVPAGAAFATVGRAARPASQQADELPEVTAVTRAGGSRPAARLSNRSDIPQPDLHVYAWSLRSGRFVAAGRARLPRLAPGQSRDLGLRLVGSAAGQTTISAPPTSIR